MMLQTLILKIGQAFNLKLG